MTVEFFTPTDLIGTLSYAIIALSYLMTNIFWLRVSAVVGLFIEIAYFHLSGGDLKVGIGWSLIFIGINLYQLLWLVRERASLRLPEKDASFLREALSGLDDSQIAKLLKAADWKDAHPSETLTRENAPVDALYFLCSGRASVVVNGSFVTYLDKGSFIGEMAYLTGNLATATVVIDEPSRILVISKSRMAKITAADKQISGIIYQLLGRDLAKKIRNSNTRMALASDESARV
ncbi:MAG: cyclic nucleotide-binding domain-containing protein [Aestuariivirga sp.]